MEDFLPIQELWTKRGDRILHVLWGIVLVLSLFLLICCLSPAAVEQKSVDLVELDWLFMTKRFALAVEIKGYPVPLDTSWFEAERERWQLGAMFVYDAAVEVSIDYGDSVVEFKGWSLRGYDTEPIPPGD